MSLPQPCVCVELGLLSEGSVALRQSLELALNAGPRGPGLCGLVAEHSLFHVLEVLSKA